MRLFGICERETSLIDSIVKVETLAKESDAILDRFFVDVRHRLNGKWGLPIASVGGIVLLLNYFSDSLFAFQFHVANSVGGFWLSFG